MASPQRQRDHRPFRRDPYRHVGVIWAFDESSAGIFREEWRAMAAFGRDGGVFLVPHTAGCADDEADLQGGGVIQGEKVEGSVAVVCCFLLGGGCFVCGREDS